MPSLAPAARLRLDLNRTPSENHSHEARPPGDRPRRADGRRKRLRGPAQQNIPKVGVIEYTTNSKTNGIQGIGVPPGADAETGNAATLLFTYERLFTPNVGLESW